MYQVHLIREKIIFQQKIVKQLDTYMQKAEFRILPHTIQKHLNSNWFIDLSVKVQLQHF